MLPVGLPLGRLGLAGRSLGLVGKLRCRTRGARDCGYHAVLPWARSTRSLWTALSGSQNCTNVQSPSDSGCTARPTNNRGGRCVSGQ